MSWKFFLNLSRFSLQIAVRLSSYSAGGATATTWLTMKYLPSTRVFLMRDTEIVNKPQSTQA
jgi:hypothetical protein